MLTPGTASRRHTPSAGYLPPAGFQIRDGDEEPVGELAVVEPRLVGQRIAARQDRHDGERHLRDCVGTVSRQRYAGSYRAHHVLRPFRPGVGQKWCGCDGLAKPAHLLGRRAAGCTSSSTCPLRCIQRIPGRKNVDVSPTVRGRHGRNPSKGPCRGWNGDRIETTALPPAGVEPSAVSQRPVVAGVTVAAQIPSQHRPMVLSHRLPSRRSEGAAGRRRLRRLREPENGQPCRASPRVRERVAVGRSSTTRIAHPDLRYGQIRQFRIA
ncbi:Uncharacterised protein [Actinomadura madurae]|nr:Uncharacterised protein [Actinomadura madurae]